ncbi:MULTISPECIES: hypothetical protein [Prochlorococcus]|uniref:hypothetical protein n=1 Tax=Prochlorococcus TaxID=1218 RepID=UPI001F299191|nr:hypothetical protein [Prochlorococcus marinus]
MSAASRPDPRAMEWQTNGELARGDLFELVRRLRDVELPSHRNELWRLGAKYEETE